MDAGSKWGTFTKIGSRVELNCGDWIRVGNAEFVIRYCGGGCKSKTQHSHYRTHSLCLLNEHGGRTTSPCAQGEQPITAEEGQQRVGADAHDEQERQEREELLVFLNGTRPSRWMTSSARLCQQNALADARLPLRRGHKPTKATESPLEGSSKAAAAAALLPGCLRRTSHKQSTQIPVTPLELDFISGPRMGERLTLYERISTMGRGEGSTIQVSDPVVSNISRVHCIFEYIGNRWHIRDNNSTNGTWRRLSCVLEPSKLQPLSTGLSVLAGVHELMVEEAEMSHCWLPSTASQVLEDLSKHDAGTRHSCHGGVATKTPPETRT